jgi:hypothetical protein
VKISKLPQDRLRGALHFALSVWFGARFHVVKPIFSTCPMLHYVAAMCMWMWHYADKLYSRHKNAKKAEYKPTLYKLSKAG